MASKTKRPEESTSNPLSVLGEALDAAAESIGDARADATVSARRAARKVQSGVSTGAYYTGYGVSYGLVFSGVFLKELLPPTNPLRRGFEDGALAGARTAVALRGPRKALEETVDEGSPDEPGTNE